MPMENSFTGMPVSRAAKKCPASCTVTITPNITMAANTYKIVIQSPYYSEKQKLSLSFNIIKGIFKQLFRNPPL